MNRHQFVTPPDLCAAPGCTDLRWPSASFAFGWGLCRGHAEQVADAVRQAAPRTSPPASRAANRGSQGRIYYILSDGLLKIGFARQLTRRLKAYPPSAQLLGSHAGSWDDEQRLHAHFSAHRASGREWYHPREEILEHIKAHAEPVHGPSDGTTRRPSGYPQPVRRRARSR